MRCGSVVIPTLSIIESASTRSRLFTFVTPHVAPGKAREIRPHRLPHSVNCFSSIVNTAPSFTSTLRTTQTRPRTSCSRTS